MAVLLNLSPEEFSRTFNAIETHRVDAIGRGVLSAALAGAEVIAENAPKDLGSLKQSVHAVKGTPIKIVVDAPHAGIVEMGSRPHRPPWKSIEAWVRRKLLGQFIVGGLIGPERASYGMRGGLIGPASASDFIEGYGVHGRHLNSDEKESVNVDKITFAIVNHIAKYGTKPTYFVRKSLPKLFRILKGEIEHELKNVGR